MSLTPEQRNDPRAGTFCELTLGTDAIVTGVWTLTHVGYGQHFFVDHETGDAVPVTAVDFARRDT